MTVLDPTPTGIAALADEGGLAPRGIFAVSWAFLVRQPVGSIGMVLVLIFGLAGIFAEVIAPYSPTANDFAVMTEPPSWAHWLGTDQLGRDLLSRILFGARTAFIVGMTSALVGGFSGLAIGVSSAYFGGQLDLWLQRVLDIVMAFPLIINRHALKNELLPVVTVIGIEFAFLIGGLVVTEQVFNLNGIGRLMVLSVQNQDYTLTQALVMVVVTIAVLSNLVVDLFYAWLDPRIRLA